MCVVSMVSDWGRTQPWSPFDEYQRQREKDFTQEDINKIKKFLDLLEQAKIFDVQTKQPECADDRKDKFEKALNEIIKKYYEPPVAT